MLVQLSWSCDDDDKRDCDDHDKSCHPPKIQRVFLDLQSQPDSIVFEILGKNFDRGAPPVVTLGGLYELTVNQALTNDQLITATLSSIAEKQFEFGDYRLIVSTCRDSAREDKYRKDHDSKRKDKKDKKDDQDDEECRCKDRYSLTIGGPSGPPSPITLTRESASVALSGSPETTTLFDFNVICQAGLVTGGGFSCPECLSSSLSFKTNEPLPALNGWHAAGAYSDGPAATLTVHAICAQSQ